MSSTDLFAADSIIGPDPAGDDGQPLDVLHDREYRVRAYRKRDDLVLIRGAIRDQKPPGLYFEIDREPLTIHHMQLDLEVAFPSMEVVDVTVHFETHPHHECPRIVDHYGSLVGLSIARGFTHRVRELFGGPRGCTHTTALLQAMAPVAIQCTWSMRAIAGTGSDATRELTDDQRRQLWMMNLNTCHVWSEDGEHVERIRAGGEMAPPVWAETRMVELGLAPDAWRTRMG